MRTVLKQIAPVARVFTLSVWLAACATETAIPTETRSVAALPPPPQRAAPAPTRPFLSVAQLLSLKDLTAEMVLARLGKPDSVHSEPPAEIWIYRNETCVLDIFMFADSPAGLKVLHTVTHNRQAPVKTEKNTCSPFTPATKSL